MDTMDLLAQAIYERRRAMVVDQGPTSVAALGHSDGLCWAVAHDMDCDEHRVQHLASRWAVNYSGPVDRLQLGPDLLLTATMPDRVYHT